MTLPVRLTFASVQDLALAERRPLRKFPFSIFYRILPECIEVIAVVHQSRDPGTWQRRV